MKDMLETADPSWYPRVLRVLARSFPTVSETVWDMAVTENAVEQVERKRQVAAGERCGSCFNTFVPQRSPQAQYPGMPYCQGCVNRCHDSEIADHRCAVCAPDVYCVPALDAAAAGPADPLPRPLDLEDFIAEGRQLDAEAADFEPERQGGLYVGKCDECTTGVSCEDAGRCLFEG